nr:hypothetical protein CFP56_65277 [Quercus suber]
MAKDLREKLKEDIAAIVLKARKPKSSAYIDTWPYYPEEMTRKPYPTNYTPPIFPKYNGMIRNAKEHIRRYVDTMIAYSNDRELRLREFSKSLEGCAFTWYTSLFPRSVLSWNDMAIQFMKKFFALDEKLTLLDLQQERQRVFEGWPRVIGHQEWKACRSKIAYTRGGNDFFIGPYQRMHTPVPLQDEEMTLRIQQDDEVHAFLEGIGLRPLARMVERS